VRKKNSSGKKSRKIVEFFDCGREKGYLTPAARKTSVHSMMSGRKKIHNKHHARREKEGDYQPTLEALACRNPFISRTPGVHERGRISRCGLMNQHLGRHKLLLVPQKRGGSFSPMKKESQGGGAQRGREEPGEPAAQSPTLLMVQHRLSAHLE